MTFVVPLARYAANEGGVEQVFTMHEADTRSFNPMILTPQEGPMTGGIHGTLAKSLPIQPQPGLMKDEWPPVPWQAFAPMSDEETADWGR